MEKEGSRKVKLTILSAKDIPVGDPKIYSCDPYVKISLVDEAGEKVAKVGKTTVAKQTLAPHWNESFEFQLLSSTLKLSLWDYDFAARDDFLSDLYVNVSDLPPNEAVWVSFPNDTDPKFPSSYSGRICIQMSGHESGWKPMAENDKWKTFYGKSVLNYHPNMICASPTSIEILGAVPVPGETHQRSHKPKKLHKKQKLELALEGDLEDEASASSKEKCFLGLINLMPSGQSLITIAENYFRKFSEDHGGATIKDERYSLGERTGVLMLRFNRKHQLIGAVLLLDDKMAGRPDGILFSSLRFDDMSSNKLNDLIPSFDLLTLYSAFINRLSLIPHWTDMPSTEISLALNYKATLPPGFSPQESSKEIRTPWTNHQNKVGLIIGLQKLSDSDAQQKDLGKASWRPIKLARLGIDSEIGTWGSVKDSVQQRHWKITLPEEKLVLSAALAWIGGDLLTLESLVPQILANVYLGDAPTNPPKWRYD
eukprot:TRINITY_DN7314_c0_g1_i1.p1 TRINITY_DN7314_c0_g1~~TRINITY_DN7314_c0_g1_i1.p1  ORF type:complete len:495 (-),score=74.50 TRINITY_DN7314_c0_g1_i1:17-1462(-)